jgi:hypothetical protein
MGFEPYKAEPDIWMHRVDNLKEYIAVYVDDLCILSKDPKAITDMFTKWYRFKLKGTGLIDYNLGMTFCQNNCNNLCISPQHYIEKMVESYKQMFNENPPSKANSLLDSNDHPEVDASEYLDEDGIQQYQSLIGSMQWAISFGHFDITVHVTTIKMQTCTMTLLQAAPSLVSCTS